MRRLFRLFLAIALGIPLAGSIAFDGVPAVAAPAACASGTPAPADPYPGTTAAATNFESGTLSPFVPFTAVTGTVSVSSDFAHSPGCSAYLHATQDNGSIANMSVGLASGMKEAYADGWFNITKQGVAGNNVPYFRFFFSGIRYADVFRDNATHELVLRTTGPQGFVYSTLVPTVALGTWHHLVVHVVPKGAATGVQIWWDDKSVFAQTVNISATRFDKVQLGAEHDEQMGDIYVDDVIVNSGSETPGPVPGALPGAGGGGGGGTVPPAATTAIKAAAAAQPALGSSTSAIICGLVKDGCYQRFQAGAVHYAPGVGAFATWGGIRTAWRAVGTENGKLGYPTGKEVCGLVKGGCYQRFQGGTIHYAPGVGAFPTWGGIRTAWRAVGTENGKLGYPVGKEICGLRDGGCYQGFQGGTIHYAPGVGAFATWGGIRTAWGAVGYEHGKLGYPVGKENCGLRNGGCYQRFQGGTIHYAPGVGAFATWGGIRTAWGAQGYENGRLGYPTSNEFPIGGGSVAQNYQGGRITWSAAAGTKIT
ncbi:LGFP repeat-containing protein [Arthrobacter sp. ov118]|uniref:LGFP repeat-containing protein n=1 Tax=Arthrobacter sp. ov118 TaxID=1761747 RepID=UPI0008F4137C|nr:hypothetical protein [Arthrobacter sp. ov118]SFT68342.1 LGFP repeat-containing protein [Arthrobacter sp. ov118]